LKCQTKLLDDNDLIITASKNGSSFHDPAFAKNKTLPVHRWVPWIAGFSSEFVNQAIKKYVTKRSTVLDPFSGVGTTLVECVATCNDAIGFEINPYAYLASEVKSSALEIDEKKLKQYISKYITFYNAKLASKEHSISKPPEGFATRSEFYSPKVMRKVLILLDYIDSIADNCLRDVFRLAFASTMVKYSNYSYEPSLGRRVSSGKEEITDFAVGEEVYSKLKEIYEDILLIKSKSLPVKSTVKVFNDSFFNYSKYISEDSIDLLITSPPYLNNYHYNRNTRPQLYWLGFVKEPKDMKKLELANFGTFWQTCRQKDCINLSFNLSNTDIEEKLEKLRGLNCEKGVYGGNGWANYAASYFNDCYKFLEGAKTVLRSDARALVVLGNSILQGIHIPTDVYFGKIAESIDLEVVEIHVPRATRMGNSIIKSDVRVGKAKSHDKLYESIVELRKR
jgi:DNA modification methylase